MSRLIADLRRFDPEVTPPTLPRTDVSYVEHDTVVGRLILAVDAEGAALASTYAADREAEDRLLTTLAATVSPRVLRQPPALDTLRGELDAYLDGRRQTFDIATSAALMSGFQYEVLSGLARRVGYGERTTYGELARGLHRHGAARAVGTALAGNPLCVLLPCHRVVPASGGVGGYAGGPAAKEYLLALEADHSR